MDAYQEFLNYFNIDRQTFFEWGISSTIFPPISNVSLEWSNLKERIFTNQPVFIRGYGRDSHGTQLYKDLYKKIFNNYNVIKDPNNNDIPCKLIQKLTGQKKNSDLYNYQISHIWGHTKNIFMFEAPWNVCYTPKIMDPFTGHESKGIWPVEYQKLFITQAYKLYKPFIDEYNQFLIQYNVESQIDEYLYSLKNVIPEKMLNQFSKDVKKELSPIIVTI